MTTPGGRIFLATSRITLVMLALLLLLFLAGKKVKAEGPKPISKETSIRVFAGNYPLNFIENLELAARWSGVTLILRYDLNPDVLVVSTDDIHSEYVRDEIEKDFFPGDGGRTLLFNIDQHASCGVWLRDAKSFKAVVIAKKQERYPPYSEASAFAAVMAVLDIRPPGKTKPSGSP